MSKRISLPGARSLAATLDSAVVDTTDGKSGDAGGTDGESGDAETTDGDSVVVSCPPHPQFGGDRHDSRLTAVSDDLTDSGVDCLRFDYGPWDDGDAEQRDVRQALAWARDRYDRVGLFGFSFGASMALLASVPDGDEPAPGVLSVLAPAAQVREDGDVVAGLESIECPVQVVYGERDDTADWKPVVERAKELGFDVKSFAADHFFVGQQAKAAEVVVSFLVDHLN